MSQEKIFDALDGMQPLAEACLSGQHAVVLLRGKAILDFYALIHDAFMPGTKPFGSHALSEISAVRLRRGGGYAGGNMGSIFGWSVDYELNGMERS